MVGRTLGHYEIIEPLGAGGMGEVYRARDTNLERDVAIKVLPEDFAADQERLARFEREAKVLASLNHANIAAIYGLEEADGVRFIAMECVEGETLAERLAAAGRVELGEALEIARQMAEALEAAHENGVVHRDLKPANVKVTPEGKVKVLDFGLAKAYETDGSPSEISPDLSKSPTVAAATRTGVILGTAAYMSPEQARGKPLDKRTDIWAFGCVLYEMLSGRRAFEGETVSDTMAAILKEEPDWGQIAPGVPRRVQELLQRCLQKDPRQRQRDIGDARIDIGDAVREEGTEASQEAESGISAGLRWRGHAVAGLAVGILLGSIAGFWLGSRQQSEIENTSPTPLSISTEITLPEDAPLAFGEADLGFDSPLIAISPDGRYLAYVGRNEADTQIYLRSMSSFDEAEPIAGTEGAMHVFFSPDSEWLGFLTRDELKKVSVRSGGSPQPLCNVLTAVRASWTSDQAIYFSQDEGRTISRVSEDGGRPEELARIHDIWTWGYFDGMLPDGSAALITVSGGGISRDYAEIYLLPMDSLEPSLLVKRGYDARYLASGHLLFARSGNLHVATFDSHDLEVGEAEPVVSGVSMAGLFGQAQVAVSSTGTLVYVPGGDEAVGSIAAVDLQGNVEFLGMEEQLYGFFDVSPDGTRLAVHVGGINDYILIWDITAGTGQRFQRPESLGWPIWNPEGTRVAFRSQVDGGAWAIVSQSIGEGSEPEVLLEGNTLGMPNPSSWSSFQPVVAIAEYGGESRFGYLRVDAPGQVEWVSSEGVNEFVPSFSRDGRLVAYGSDRSGSYQIWVRPYSEASVEPKQVSTDGAIEPLFCRGCDELFYRNGDRWYAARVTLGAEIDVETSPRELWQTDFIDTPGRSYDVSPDGQVLYVVKRSRQQTTTTLHVIQNLFTRLTRLLSSEALP